MNKIVLLTCIFCIPFIIWTCGTSKNSTSPPVPPSSKTYSNVDERLWIHFENFEKEAAKRHRNINLKTKGIKGNIKTIPLSVSQVGQCSTINKTLTIDATFWNTKSHLEREMLVFHELGHCALGRHHRDDKDGTVCKSIMRSASYTCNTEYTTSKRKSYLDELFSVAD